MPARVQRRAVRRALPAAVVGQGQGLGDAVLAGHAAQGGGGQVAAHAGPAPLGRVVPGAEVVGQVREGAGLEAAAAGAVGDVLGGLDDLGAAEEGLG